MTHADGTQDEELYGAMRSAIGAEPPMAAQPYEDLARGRRRLLHRRVGTALAAGAVVPAVALIASVVPDATSTNGGGDPGFSDAATDDGSLEPDCGWFGYGDDADAKAFPLPAEPGLSPGDEGTATLEPIKPPTGPKLRPSDGGGGLDAAGDGYLSCEAAYIPSSTEQVPQAAAASDTLYCPSPEEMERHWEQYGEELKPSPDCPDPDPLPEPTGPPEPPDATVNEPDTLAEAQRVFDPENDPLILVDRQPDGTYKSITGAVADPKYVPPASVKTAGEYADWLDQHFPKEQ